MPRYIAFLRGVSPTNLQMSQLRDCLEASGFSEVKTVLSSGNAAFNAGKQSTTALERRVEKVLRDSVGREFHTIVRAVADLERLIAEDPFQNHALPRGAKRVVTFYRKVPTDKAELPPERGGARILEIRKHEAFSAYVPNPKGPVFMQLIKDTLGVSVTTRTWETVLKCARA